MNPEHREQPVQLEIMKANAVNAEAIVRIQFASWLATYPNVDANITEDDVRAKFANQEKRTVGVRAQIESPREGLMTYVIKENGTVVGYCQTEKHEQENHINALYLDPRYQGKNVGSTIFRKALEELGEEKPVGLEVVEYNTRAIEFYKRFGFEDVGADALHAIGTKVMPTRHMVRATKNNL